MAVRALGGAFHYPAMAASTPLMVPGEQLTRINGLNQALQGVNSLVAPPLGALLLGILPTQGILLIDVGTATLAILPLLFLAQIAFIVAFGVLLDTLVVRSLLVPSVTYLVGPRIWWPGRLARVPDQEE
jgi:MFS family permease